jgi:hypothetical protein
MSAKMSSCSRGLPFTRITSEPLRMQQGREENATIRLIDRTPTAHRSTWLG